MRYHVMVTSTGKEMKDKVATEDKAALERIISSLSENPRPPGAYRKERNPSFKIERWEIYYPPYRIVYIIKEPAHQVCILYITRPNPAADDDLPATS